MQISSTLLVPKGTVYSWVRKVDLDSNAKIELEKRKKFGIQQTKQYWKNKLKRDEKERAENINQWLTKISFTKELSRIFAALLFWAEGSKKLNRINFTNSDPAMIQYFLQLLRSGFPINEAKLRILLHLHEYHNEQERINYWSSITKIPKSQFIKTYWKAHSGKRRKKGYPGTCDIYYYDSNLAKTLKSIYQAISVENSLPQIDPIC